jgi:hypothetical protein
MKLSITSCAGLGVAVGMFAMWASAMAADPPEPKFTAITLDDHIQIGYGLAIADVDGDGYPDILLADKKQFVWYRNPGPSQVRDPAAWHKYLLAENLTEDDNVCIAAQDIDGDGKCEIAVGAAWKPSDTEKSGAVFYLIPPADRTQPWTPVKFPTVEPTTHRMRWIQLNDGTWGLVVLPLHGRGNKNGEGKPVKMLLYHPPAPLNDTKGEWRSEVVDESMHMTHNFLPFDGGKGHMPVILIAGKEGIRICSRDSEKNWQPANHAVSLAAAGEVRESTSSGPLHFVASVEPMHGNQLVAHIRSERKKPVPDGDWGPFEYHDHLLTDRLVEGHALQVGDFLGTKGDQIAIGWRGKAGTVDTPIGIAVWTPLDAQGDQWRETLIDPNGMACEDLQIADLTGHGKLDIIASGRRTHNVKIYFNDTAAPNP